MSMVQLVGRKARRVGVVATAVGLAASMAACSSSSASGSGPSNQSTSSAAAGSPIVIGTVGAYSGALASDSVGSLKVVQGWVSMVNASGGINGRPLKLIVKDTGNSASVGVEAVKELVTQEHVVAIVGEHDTQSANWASYIASTGVPVIGGDPVDSAYWTNADFFPAGGNLYAVAYGVAKAAGDAGGSVAVTYCGESPVCAQVGTLMKNVASAAHTSVASSIPVSASATDYTAVCQQIKDSHAAFYLLTLTATTATRVAAQCSQQGLTAKPVVISATPNATFATQPGWEGGLEVDADFPFFDSSTPATKAYRDMLTKYAPLSDALDGPGAAQAWAGAQLFQKAAESVSGLITPDSLKAALYAMKNETLGGLAPPLNFTKGKPPFIGCYFTYGIEGGKWTATNGLTTQCMPAALVDTLASK